MVFHAASDQVLFGFGQLGIPERDDHSLARLAFLVAVRLDQLDQLTALDDFGAEKHAPKIEDPKEKIKSKLKN
jgi:hypothetical protein